MLRRATEIRRGKSSQERGVIENRGVVSVSRVRTRRGLIYAPIRSLRRGERVARKTARAIDAPQKLEEKRDPPRPPREGGGEKGEKVRERQPI